MRVKSSTLSLSPDQFQWLLSGIDFMNQKGHLIKKSETGLDKKEVPVEKGEPLALELDSFIQCVHGSLKPKTDGTFGKTALEVALSITKQINISL